MRFKRHMELEHGLKQIEITPLIDMVFLLLIFFLLTSNFVVQPGIKVDLPPSLTSETLRPGNIVITISGENITYFDAKAVTPGELKSLIRQAAGRKQAVQIRADRRASLGKVVEIWDTCRDSGVGQISLATNQE